MKKPTIFNLLSPLRTLSALPVRKKIYIVILLLLIITLFGLIVICLPPGIDWLNVYRPSALNLLSAKSPYEISGYYNPPWAALFFVAIRGFSGKGRRSATIDRGSDLDIIHGSSPRGKTLGGHHSLVFSTSNAWGS